MLLLKLLKRIPEHLSERTRIVSSPAINSGAFVLYWMKTAVRGHENPALDTAIEMANLLGQPVFVYHGLSSRYPYASDRHHRFILEGALDVQSELEKRQLGYAFHLERPNCCGPYLKQLAAMASMVVTEDMPTDSMRSLNRALAKAIPVPLLRVDTACVVPMATMDRYYSRGFSFREATVKQSSDRIGNRWVEAVSEHPGFRPNLPFEPYKLNRKNFEADIALCQIDHGVCPVPDTTGGSEAGYKRWKQFKLTGIRQYHQKRNNPSALGVSRMSGYLHYGHVSPFRIAREASEISGPGPKKFLDELITWRELAYVWCDHHTDLDNWKHIPQWAQRSLEDSSKKYPPVGYSYETLHRGQTDDELWNACQRSLLKHGELHNNLRMTWGKQLIPWAGTPQEAHRWAIDFNHRYALDGRDPASYGGLLWCFGLFDRAFKPPNKGFGVVRPRTTKEQKKRTNMASLLKHIDRPRHRQMPSVAIIGAGMAGLACARVLKDHGLDVEVFDKGWNAGGRMSTRLSREDSRWVLDHGTPSFHCTDKRFLLRVKSWEQHGLVSEWNAPIGELTNSGQFIEPNSPRIHYVGRPKMSAIGEHMALDLNVHTQTRIDKLQRHQHKWKLMSEDGKSSHGLFDELVVTAPAQQTREILPDRMQLPWLTEHLKSKGCLTVMVRLSEHLNIPWGMVRCEHPVLSLVVQENTKPGRNQNQLWVLHAMGDWANANLDGDPDQLQRTMVESFFDLVNTKAEVDHLQVHRWRYALPLPEVNVDGCFRDALEGLSICGDWLSQSTNSVQAAYLSGVAAAGRLLGQI